MWLWHIKQRCTWHVQRLGGNICTFRFAPCHTAWGPCVRKSVCLQKATPCGGPLGSPAPPGVSVPYQAWEGSPPGCSSPADESRSPSYPVFLAKVWVTHGHLWSKDINGNIRNSSQVLNCHLNNTMRSATVSHQGPSNQYFVQSIHALLTICGSGGRERPHSCHFYYDIL